MVSNPEHERKIDKFLLATLDDATARMQYTYKCHEKAADKYNCWESWRRVLSIFSTVLTAGTFLTALWMFFGADRFGGVITGAIATIGALTATIGDVLHFPEKCDAHRKAGAETRKIFVMYENLRADYFSGALDSNEVRKRRDEILEEEQKVLAELPRTTHFDYRMASRALKHTERTSESQDQLRSMIKSGI